MLTAQIFALILIPFLSGAVPQDGVIGPLTLFGLDREISEEFLVGKWRVSDEFFRWGITDKDKARIRSTRSNSYMTLNKDGSVEMTNLFRPEQGTWELTRDGIVVYDPSFPNRASQVLPVRKRDANRIWVLLPFTGGSAGIGLVRADEHIPTETRPEHPKENRRFQRTDRPYSGPSLQREISEMNSSGSHLNSDGTRREFVR